MKKIITLLCLVSFLALQAGEFNWEEFHSASGNCNIVFPTSPKHFRETMTLNESNVQIHYDAYISSEKKEVVYLLLIAHYPMQIETGLEEASLESFLNGLIKQGGRLIYANLLDVQGTKAVEFFIQNQSVYFKGRALIKGTKLYLMAVESQENYYEDNLYHRFIESFRFFKRK